MKSKLNLKLFLLVGIANFALSSMAFSQDEILSGAMDKSVPSTLVLSDFFVKMDLERAKQSLRLALQKAPQFGDTADVTAIEATRVKSGFILLESQIELFRKTSDSVLELCSAKADVFQKFEISKCNAVTNFDYIFRGILVEMKLNQKFFDSVSIVMSSPNVFERIQRTLEMLNLDRVNRVTINRSGFSDDYGLFNMKLAILSERDGKTVKCVGMLVPQIESVEITKNNYRSLPTINFSPKTDLICGDNKRGKKN